MISGVLRNGNREESALLEQSIRSEAAYYTDEQVSIVVLQSKEELANFLKKKELVDIICIDVSLMDGIWQAEELRRNYPKATIIVVADIRMSPVTYMKPTIVAAALLLKPLLQENVQQVMKAVFEEFIEKCDDEEVFLIDTRENRQRIPVNRILYFEARAKKIYACTINKEFGFYDTMDQLEEKMQPIFLRCHRSYLVNCDYVEKVMLSRNSLLLKDDIDIPLSRSYKEAVKHRFLKKEGDDEQ